MQTEQHFKIKKIIIKIKFNHILYENVEFL